MAYNDGTPINFGPDEVDNSDDVLAQHINEVREEIESIIAALGTAAGIKGGLADLAAYLAKIVNTGTPTTQAFGDSAVTGASGNMADKDHKHAMPSSVVEADLAASSVSSAKIKTGTGSATGTTGTDVVMNAYTFFPNLTANSATRWDYKSWNASDPGDQVARARIQGGGGTWVLNWGYITASRPPELVIVRDNARGEIVTVWKSEIQNDDPPVSCEGPDCELIELVKFPDAVLNKRASQLLDDIKGGHLRLNDRIARPPESGKVVSQGDVFMEEARKRKRRVLPGAALGELFG